MGALPHDLRRTTRKKREKLNKTELKADEEFKNLIPPLTPEEYSELEESIKADGCRDALVVWDGVILDGHNRFEICNRHGIIFKMATKNMDGRDAAKIWIIKNQFGRRNITDAWQLELRQKLKVLLIGIGKKKLSDSGTKGGRGNKKPLPDSGKPFKHNTRKELAHELGWSTGKLSEAEVVQKHPEIWEEVKKGTKSIDGAYREIKRNKQKELKESSDFHPKVYDVWNKRFRFSSCLRSRSLWNQAR